MGRRPGSKNKKGKFENLSQEFRDGLDGLSKEELQTKLANVAKALELNAAAMKADQDLNEKKDAVKAASAGYNEVKKDQRMKAEYLIVMLSDKGDDFAEQLVKLHLQAAEQNG